MNKLIRWIAAWVVLVVLFAGTFLTLDIAGTNTVAPATAADPISSSAEAGSSVEAKAKVVPANSARLSFPTKGVGDGLLVTEVLVREGDKIEQGAPLARLDTRALQLAVDDAQAALAQAQASYDKLRADIDAAKLRSDAEMAKLRADADVAKLRVAADVAKLRADASTERALGRPVSASMIESSAQTSLQAAAAEEASVQANLEKLAAARSASDSANAADMASAQAQIQQAEARLKQSQLDLDLATLRTPISGTVTEMNLKVGEVPSLTEPAIVLADFSSWQIQTDNLTDRSVVRIREGDPATITFDALPGFQLSGKVAQIKAVGEENLDNANITYTVNITPEQYDKRLRWNMPATVTIKPSGSLSSVTPSTTTRTEATSTSSLPMLTPTPSLPTLTSTPVLPTLTSTVIPTLGVNSSNYLEHTVQQGELLRTIAQQYGVSMEEILALNTIDDPNSLKVGQIIRIPKN